VVIRVDSLNIEEDNMKKLIVSTVLMLLATSTYAYDTIIRYQQLPRHGNDSFSIQFGYNIPQIQHYRYDQGYRYRYNYPIQIPGYYGQYGYPERDHHHDNRRHHHHDTHRQHHPHQYQ